MKATKARKTIMELIFTVFMTVICAIPCFAEFTMTGHYDPDGTTSTYYAYDSSECNRTVNVSMYDTNGTLIKKVSLKTKHGEDNSLSVITSRQLGRANVNVPFCSHCHCVLRDMFVAFQRSVGIERDVIRCKQIGLTRFVARLTVYGIGLLMLREQNELLAVFGIACDKSARTARRPTILVVKPRKHALLLCFFVAKLDHVHKIASEIFGCHSRTRVNMIAAKAH